MLETKLQERPNLVPKRERQGLVKEQLFLANRRNITIPAMIRAKDVNWKRLGYKTALMRIIGDLYIDLDSNNIRGVENLETADRLSEDHRLIVTQNHQTDLDHQAKRLFLETLGFREFADRLVYTGGLKMDERWYIRFFVRSEQGIFIATPADLDRVQAVLTKDKKDHFLQEAQRSSLEMYRGNLTLLNQTAMENLAALNRQGLITAIYPEATRSRHPDSLIQRAPKSVALYTLPQEGQPEAFVLPISVGGLNEVLPPQKLMRFWKVLPPNWSLGIFSKASIRVNIGAPYPASEIWDRRRAVALKKMGAEKSDYIMAKIAVLNPDLVTHEDWEFYQRVLAA